MFTIAAILAAIGGLVAARVTEHRARREPDAPARPATPSHAVVASAPVINRTTQGVIDFANNPLTSLHLRLMVPDMRAEAQAQLAELASAA